MSAVQELTDDREKARLILVEKREAAKAAVRAQAEAERAVKKTEAEEATAQEKFSKLAHAVRTVRSALGMRDEEDD